MFGVVFGVGAVCDTKSVAEFVFNDVASDNSVVVAIVAVVGFDYIGRG